MSGIARFVLDRLTEDRLAVWHEYAEVTNYSPDRTATLFDVGAVMVGHKRFVAEMEAKMRLVDEHAEFSHEDGRSWCSTCAPPHPRVWPGYKAFPCLTMKLLALPYADHPDYREEWKP